MFLIVFEHPERAIVRDSQSYLIPAINIVDGHGFSSRVQPPFTASANRTPGYPLFIATLYALFGRNVVVIAFVQVLIDTVSTILTYYLGLRLVSNKAAFLGALGYALSLGPAIYAVLIMTETLFTLCLLGAIITFTRYRDRNQVRWLVGGGLLIGIAVLIRPIALFFPLAALLLIWVDPLTRGRRFLTNGAVFLVTVAAVVAPWVLRNYRTIGLATVSTISSYNLLYFNAVSLDADLHGVSQADARDHACASRRGIDPKGMGR